MAATGLDVRSYWLDVIKTPARVLATGIAVLALAFIWKVAIGTGLIESLTVDASNGQVIIGLLVLFVAICLVGFLWWLTTEFFHLVRLGRIDGASMENIKDLPMGLPEGTVRAILALIVAMVGLPLLLFQRVLDIDAAIAGYVNGIIAGVFGFYFGTRTSGVPAKAVDKIADAQNTAIQKASEAAAATAQAETARSELAAKEAEVASARSEATDEVKRAQQAGGFDKTLATLTRQIALANTVLKTFGPVLPPGLIPAGAADIVADAGRAVASLGGVSAAQATREQLDELSKLADVLTGGTSPVGALLRQAAPLFATVAPVPGLGPVAAMAAVLGLGAKLGSGQYQRWRARVLAAPVSQALVEFGTVTPEVVHAALRQAPLLGGALASRPPVEVETILTNAIGSPDKAELLLAAYGPQGTTAPGLLEDAAHVKAGLAQLQQAVLALYSAHDIEEQTVRQMSAGLGAPALPELASAAAQSALRTLSPSDATRLVDAVAGISAREDLPQDQRAAFDALVMLVDAARAKNIDLVAALAELRQ